MEENLNTRIDKLEEKLNKIIEILENDVKKDCKKMNSHIDFIETIYANVKSPLGYFFDKLNYFKGNDTRVYSIETGHNSV